MGKVAVNKKGQVRVSVRVRVRVPYHKNVKRYV
jgi:hypothetical protein